MKIADTETCCFVVRLGDAGSSDHASTCQVVSQPGLAIMLDAVGIGVIEVGERIEVIGAFDDELRGNAGHRVDEVVVLIGWMVDHITAAAGGAAFERDELIEGALIVQQGDACRVQQSQRVLVQVGLGLGGRLDDDAEFSELFAHPLAAESISRDLGKPVGLQHRGEFGAHGLGRERRPAFSQAIDDNDLLRRLVMRDAEREAVRGTAARVAECAVADIAQWRALEYPALNATFSDLATDEGFEIGTELRHVLCRSAKLIGVLRGHERRFSYAAFSPDGNSVVTPSFDGSALLCLWDVKTRKLIAS
jgi:hypothetical protein